MDFATVGGLLLAIILIAVGAYFEHVTLKSIMGLSAFLIVFGGTTGVTIFSHTMEDLKRIPRAVWMTIFPPKTDYPGMIAYLAGLADHARRKGLLSLQDEAEKASNPLVKRGLTMVVDGGDPEVVADTLEAMAHQMQEKGMHSSAVFATAGGYCPTIGIMGTVMGLVQVMGNLAEPEQLGQAIAVAFLATLYGVAFANVLFLPLASKIKGLTQQQAKFNEMVVEGIIGIQSGENPRNLTEKLSIYSGDKAAPGALKQGASGSPAVEEGA